MTLQEYIASIKGKTVAVVGIGVSNTPLIELLAKNGVQVTACDRKTRPYLGAQAAKLEAMGVTLKLGDSYLEGLDQEIIFRTPGMRQDVPELLAAKERGSVITSEMEVFFEVCPCMLIAVTGSDGKTTTTTLIAEFLKAAGKTVHLGGNIGHPLLSEAGEMQPSDYAVLELSSFQLMTMTRSPHIAVITNISPNHLDVHKGMREYVEAKENIYKHQSAEDIAVFNMDNSVTGRQAAFAEGRIRFFSRLDVPPHGVFLRDGEIFSRRDGQKRKIMDAADILLPGIHNVEN